MLYSCTVGVKGLTDFIDLLTVWLIDWLIDLCVDCGGVLTTDSGSLRSPRHPSVYPHGVNCTWFIRARPGFVIELTFSSFLLERRYNCLADYVEIFDSHTSEHSLGRYRNTSIRYNTIAEFNVDWKTECSVVGLRVVAWLSGNALVSMVYGRFPDGYFPRMVFSRKDVSQKVVSRVVIFPGWYVSRKDFVNGRPNL